MHCLGVIPARGGSRGIPGKNLILLAGKPLLAYTAEAALRSSLTATIVSTDDETIANAGRTLGLTVPFLRPAALAQDDTPMLDVLKHAVDNLPSDIPPPDVIVLLQPTSPLRPASRINEAINMLSASDADVVVSVVEVPHQFSPQSLMTMDNNSGVRPWMEGPAVLRRQDKEKLYARNGPAVLAMTVPYLKTCTSFYAGKTLGLLMPREESVDIDDSIDLMLAEALLLQQKER